jgi:hypothetical protein
MATLNKTGGATIVVSTSTVQYAGNDVNCFFGGSSDRIAMLAFDDPAAFGVDEFCSSAVLRMQVKADTTADYDTITIGLIDGAWSGGDDGYSAMYSYLVTSGTITAYLATSLTEAEKSISVTSLLQTWATNPTSYAGLYLRCSTLSLARVGATSCDVTTAYTARANCGEPTAVTLYNLNGIVETAPLLSWSGASGGTENAITGYEIQYAESTDGTSYGSWTALSTVTSTATFGSVSVALPSARGKYRKYQIRTQGAAGSDYYSAWVITDAVRYNTTPTAPTIDLPQNGKTIYNPLPRFLITIGADADNQLQTFLATGFTQSHDRPHLPASKIMLQRTAAATAGTVSLSATQTDTLASTSSAATRSTTYAVPTYTDSTITAGTTAIKAAHITELRTYINTVRAYYGLADVSWADTITAHVTSTAGWAAHVAEMQSAIDDVVTLVNAWDAQAEDNLIEVPTWIVPDGKRPQADVIEQLRSVLVTL